MLGELGISEEVISNLKLIIESVSACISDNFRLIYDSTIIRGQGYYTGTIYEVYDNEFGRAIGAGGRYDKMVEKFTDNSTPAVGFSIGFYSTVMLMIEKGIVVPNKKLALIYDKNNSYADIMQAKQSLIEKGYQVSTFAFPKNFNNFVQKIKQSNFTLLVKMQDINKIISL